MRSIFRADSDDVVERLRGYLDDATPEQWYEGVNWYRRAHEDCRVLGLQQEIGCAVVAVLSPSLPWKKNIDTARLVVESFQRGITETRGYAAYGANIAKAFRLLEEADPMAILDVLGGVKVRAFYSCLVDPWHTTAVVVDGHMIAAALGEPSSVTSLVKATFGRAQQLDDVAAQIRTLAADYNLRPCQAQAIIWLSKRGTPR